MKFPSLENVGPTETFRRELRSLDRESDPELYFKGLLTAAYRLNQRGEIQAARQLFQIIQTESRENFPEASKRAEREIDALEGRGAFGQRVEFLGRSLFREAASPSALAGMAGAQAVFGLARAAFLFRLGALPTANFLTRGLGARVVASTGAFALEAPSFVAFHRGAKAALGEQQEWNPRILGEEFAASFLTLGALKLGAWAGGARKGLGQASTLGGILLGNRLEERAGLRGSSDGLNALTDGLATLLHLKVAGRLLGAAMGPRWADFQRELHWRGEGRGGPGRGPALAWRSLAPATGAGTFENPNILMMRGPKDRGSILEGELLEKAPHSVHRRIEKIRAGRKWPIEPCFGTWSRT